MIEESLIKDAFDSIIDCDKVKAMRILENAEETGVDLVELLIYGYNAGVEYSGDLFCRGKILLPKLISSTQVLKVVMTEFERKMAVPEIKSLGVDYCLFK